MPPSSHVLIGRAEDALIAMRPLSPESAIGLLRRHAPRGVAGQLVADARPGSVRVLGRFDLPVDALAAAGGASFPVIMFEVPMPTTGGVATFALSWHPVSEWFVRWWPGPAGEGYCGERERPGSALRGVTATGATPTAGGAAPSNAAPPAAGRRRTPKRTPRR